MKALDFFARIDARLNRGVRNSTLDVLPARPQRAAVPSRAELVERFCAELARLGGAVQRAPDVVQLEARLLEFLRASGAQSSVAFSRECFAGFASDQLWREPSMQAWGGGGEAEAKTFRAAAAAADVGISIADLAVASSGSLLFLADAARPRSVSLLPRSHVALLDARHLVADLAAALGDLEARGVPPSSALFVSGPSRTSDIENDLTLGVHGPAAVTVFLLDP